MTDPRPCYQAGLRRRRWAPGRVVIPAPAGIQTHLHAPPAGTRPGRHSCVRRNPDPLTRPAAGTGPGRHSCARRNPHRLTRPASRHRARPSFLHPQESTPAYPPRRRQAPGQAVIPAHAGIHTGLHGSRTQLSLGSLGLYPMRSSTLVIRFFIGPSASASAVASGSTAGLPIFRKISVAD